MTNEVDPEKRRLGRTALSKTRRWINADRARAVLVSGSLVVAISLVYLSRDHYFFGDDWDYLLTRGTVPGQSRGWFAPHGDHWSTAVVAINRLLFAFFGLRTYVPWSLVVIAFHIGICFALFRLLRRFDVHPWTALVTVWALLFYGWGAEAYLWDAAMNLTGSLLFALIALLVVTRDGRTGAGWRWYALPWGLLVVGLMFSGGGLPGVLLVALFVGLDRGRRAGLVLASVPAGVFVVWYLVWGRNGNGSMLDPATLYYRVPRYVGRGLTDALDNLTVLVGAGSVLVVAVLVVPFLGRQQSRLHMLAIAGTAAAVGQLTLAGATRIVLGFDYAGSGRYAYLTIAYLVPALALVLTEVTTRVRAPQWVVALSVSVLLATLAADGTDRNLAYADGAAGVRGPWRERVIGTIEAVDRGERVLSQTPGDDLNKSARASLLTSKSIREAAPRGEATPQGLLDAEAMYMVGVDDGLQGLFAPAELAFGDGFSDRGQVAAPGCSTHSTLPGGVLTLPVGSGNEFSVTGPAQRIETKLERGGLETGVRTWSAEPNRTTFIASSAKDATLVVKLDAGGEYLICTAG